MPTISLHNFVWAEARMYWLLSRAVAEEQRCPTDETDTPTNIVETRDELDTLAEMSDSPAIIRMARARIADIDMRWPTAKVA